MRRLGSSERRPVFDLRAARAQATVEGATHLMPTVNIRSKK